MRILLLCGECSVHKCIIWKPDEHSLSVVDLCLSLVRADAGSKARRPLMLFVQRCEVQQEAAASQARRQRLLSSETCRAFSLFLHCGTFLVPAL